MSCCFRYLIIEVWLFELRIKIFFINVFFVMIAGLFTYKRLVCSIVYVS